jgi:hypothetical protein
MTRAVTLANLAIQDILTVDGENNRVGIGSTQPTEKLDVVGVVSATSFYGDGSNLQGVATTKLLTIGVRVGAAVTFEVVGSGFTVSGRSANITIDI